MNSPYSVHPASSPEALRPAATTGRGVSRLEYLLGFEAMVREAPDADQVILHAVNDARNVVDYLQACFLRRTRTGKFRCEAVSSLAGVDRNAPFVRWVERLANMRFQSGSAGPQNFSVSLEEAGAAAGGAAYPFRHFAGLPLADRSGEVFGLLLFIRDKPFEEAQVVIGRRLAGATAHALMALTPPSRLKGFALPRKWIVAAFVLALLAMFIPVPMTALAPVEVVADNPVVVAAPLDGVVHEVVPDPSTDVRAGDVLFRLDDTTLRAEMEVAERKLLVAEARLATALQAAFGETAARREVAIAEAEVKLATAERDYVASRLAKVNVTAERDGVVIYTDRKDWTGKPVATGERVMEIADPRRIAYRIGLATSDAIALAQDARVKVFLDARPLSAIPARLTEAGYLAEEGEGGVLSYRLLAHDDAGQGDLHGDDADAPRIGLRGTAQVYGYTVPLGFYLFRRPLAALRQSAGF